MKPTKLRPTLGGLIFEQHCLLLYPACILSRHYRGTSAATDKRQRPALDTEALLTIMALIRVFPPSTNEPAVAASTGEEAEASHRANSETGGNIGNPQQSIWYKRCGVEKV